MPRFERLRSRLASTDWRGWFALGWVVWFGLLYGKMVVEQRGGKVRAAVSGLAVRPGDALRSR
jgi:hypothetical protein